MKYLGFIILISLLAWSGNSAADNQKCRRSGGNIVGSRCYCPSAKMFFDPAGSGSASTCSLAASRAVARTAGALSGALKMPSCPPETLQKCPQAIIQSLLQDQSTSIWGSLGGLKSPDANCESTTPSARSILPQQLEKMFSENPEYSLGSPAPVQITGGGCLDSNARRSLASNKPFSNEEKKKVVGEYYFAMRRLNDGELQSFESVAAIDSLLRNPPLDKINCTPSGNPNANIWCEKLKSCAPKSEEQWARRYNRMIEQTEFALTAKNAIEKELAQLQSQQKKSLNNNIAAALQPSSRQGASNRQKVQTIEQLTGLLNNINAQSPWINGKTFKKIIAANPKNVKGAFNEQLKSNRAALQSRLAKIESAKVCLNHPSRLRCSEAAGVLKEMPSFQEKKIEPGPFDYVSNAQCRIGTRSANAQWDETGKEIFEITALTAATWGIGSLAAGARAASAGSALQGARLGEAAVLGLDAANAGVSMKRAAEVCTGASLVNQKVGPVDLDAGPTCKEGFSGPNLVSDAQGCMTAVLTDVLPNLVPFVPAIHLRAKMRMLALAEKAGLDKFEARFTMLGGNMDDVLEAASQTSPQAQAKFAKFLSSLDTNAKISAFKKDFDALKGRSICTIGP